MNLFRIIGEDLFRPLTSSYKEIYLDCLNIIYDCCGQKTSNSEDRSVIIDCLVDYFEDKGNQDINLDDNADEKLHDPKAKASTFLLKLKQFGWIYEDIGRNYILKISLNDYAVSLLDCFRAIVKDEETEYQNVIQTIYSIVINSEAYQNKPYENILIGVEENVEKLTKELKKLSTNIKKYIDRSTFGKDAAEIIEDYFTYHKEIGSKAYHRLKTSNNISRFRPIIIAKLKYILDDKGTFEKTISGYMEIKDVKEREQAESDIKQLVNMLQKSLHEYDDIIEDIEAKNLRYTSSSIERAKFLLSTDTNIEGKINKILSIAVNELNHGASLFDDDQFLSNVFAILPIRFIDGESFYTMPQIRNNGQIQKISDEEFDIKKIEQARMQMAERLKNMITLDKVNLYVEELLKTDSSTLASQIPLGDKKEFIKLIFISFYGTKSKKYAIIKTDNVVVRNGFRYRDFKIIRK